MKNSFVLTIASVFAVLLLAGFASAVSLTDSNLISQPVSVNHNAGSFQIQFNLTNSGTPGTLYWDTSSFNSSQSGLTFTFDKSTIGNGSITPVTENYVATISFNSAQSGTITGTIVAGNTAGTGDEFISFSVPITNTPTLLVSDASIPTGSNATTFTITNTGNVPLTGITLTDSGAFDVTLNETTISSLAVGQVRTISVTIDTDDLEDLVGTQTLSTIRANTTYGTTAVEDTGSITTAGQFCEYSNLGNNLKMDLEVTGVEGLGDEDESILPMDEVTFEVTVENEGDEDINDIEVVWGVYNTKTGQWLIDTEEEDTFDLNDGEEKTLTITFEVEDADELDGEDYAIYVKATGEDEENDGNNTCLSISEELTIKVESDLVVVRNIEMPVDAFCGQDTELTAEIWNIGDEDQEDVTLTIYNKELGISEQYTFDEIGAFEKESVTLQFTIPSDADGEKVYYLTFDVKDEDGEFYEYDDDEIKVNKALKISGGCVSVLDMEITPNLASEAIAGQELIVNATIKNTGKKQQTFTINVDGLTDWAELGSIDKTTLLLSAGQSQTITIKLNVNKDVEGSESFTINAATADGSVYSQPVSVAIENTGFSFGDLLQGNKLYWAIGIINVILVIAIIIVIVRILAK